MAETILHDHRETEVERAVADGARLWMPLEDLERVSGWSWKPEGVCRGEVCVPGRDADWLDSAAGRLDFAGFAARLGHPAVRDEAHHVWAFGPTTGRGVAADSGPVIAPDLRLPDLDGKLHSLAEQRGKKVLLYCWASW